VNWEAIGAVGEIIGALAVVASLAYLAVQIRQNTRQVTEQNLSNRMNSLTAVGNGFTAFRTRITSSEALSALWAKGSSDLTALNAEERQRFDLLCVDFFWAWGLPWLYVQQGVFDKEFWDFTSANLPLYAHPGIRAWWSSSEHRSEYPKEFVRLVDRLLALDRESADARLGDPSSAER